MIKNKKIKANEVQLIGINGEDLGIVHTSEALALAKKLKVDLVCSSLMTSPPPCKLIGSSEAKLEEQQAKKQERKPRLKEIRLTPQIEDHDFETKRKQAERILQSGDAVLLVVRFQGIEGTRAKELFEAMIKELNSVGNMKTGIQLSDKQAVIQIDPIMY